MRDNKIVVNVADSEMAENAVDEHHPGGKAALEVLPGVLSLRVLLHLVAMLARLGAQARGYSGYSTRISPNSANEAIFVMEHQGRSIGCQKEGNGEYPHEFCALGFFVCDLHPRYFIIQGLDLSARGKKGKALTPMIAGSSGTCGGLFSITSADFSIRRSLTSLPRKTMKLYTLSEAATSSSPDRRPSVP